VIDLVGRKRGETRLSVMVGQVWSDEYNLRSANGVDKDVLKHSADAYINWRKLHYVQGKDGI
jgi:hypothetical protein